MSGSGRGVRAVRACLTERGLAFRDQPRTMLGSPVCRHCGYLNELHETLLKQEKTMDLAAFEDQSRQILGLLRHEQLREWLVSQPGLVQRWGTWVEFGVGGGESLSFWERHRGRAQLWGFDSFRGLPEDWNEEHPKGRFAEERPIMPPVGVRLCVGQFSETLPAWKPAPVTFAHIDCDLYSSAKTALAFLWPQLADGAVLLFDDFFTPPADNGVMRALFEQPSPTWEYLARDLNADSAAIRVFHG